MGSWTGDSRSKWGSFISSSFKQSHSTNAILSRIGSFPRRSIGWHRHTIIYLLSYSQDFQKSQKESQFPESISYKFTSCGALDGQIFRQHEWNQTIQPSTERENGNIWFTDDLEVVSGEYIFIRIQLTKRLVTLSAQFIINKKIGYRYMSEVGKEMNWRTYTEILSLSER